MAKKVWLARNSVEWNEIYSLYTTKPDNHFGRFTNSENQRCWRIARFDSEDFESAFGYSIEPGECQRVELDFNPV